MLGPLKGLLLQIIGIYETVLIFRFLLSWVPNINWQDMPWKIVFGLTEPFLIPFRRAIPPIGMLDISAMVAFFALQLLQSVISGL
jgi:YggT family protein